MCEASWITDREKLSIRYYYNSTGLLLVLTKPGDVFLPIMCFLKGPYYLALCLSWALFQTEYLIDHKKLCVYLAEYF